MEERSQPTGRFRILERASNGREPLYVRSSLEEGLKELERLRVRAVENWKMPEQSVIDGSVDWLSNYPEIPKEYEKTVEFFVRNSSYKI